jgi:hypothetical protein
MVDRTGFRLDIPVLRTLSGAKAGPAGTARYPGEARSRRPPLGQVSEDAAGPAHDVGLGGPGSGGSAGGGGGDGTGAPLVARKRHRLKWHGNG